MRTISVIWIVDVEGALSTGNLQNNVYMVDTNAYLGSWIPGSNDLHTVCQDTQKIKFHVKAINPDNEVQILGFSGNMVTSGILEPKPLDDQAQPAWGGKVESRGGIGQYNYFATLEMDGRQMGLQAYLKVV